MTQNNMKSKLFDLAKASFANAYAPYSKFSVGAAIMDNAGLLHSGCNVENAAYPQGVCAEANAIGAMIAAGSKKISAIMVLADGDGPVFPCGGCRQKILEFSEAETIVLIATPQGVTQEIKFSDLMPYTFGAASLGS